MPCYAAAGMWGSVSVPRVVLFFAALRGLKLVVFAQIQCYKQKTGHLVLTAPHLVLCLLLTVAAANLVLTGKNTRILFYLKFNQNSK